MVRKARRDRLVLRSRIRVVGAGDGLGPADDHVGRREVLALRRSTGPPPASAARRRWKPLALSSGLNWYATTGKSVSMRYALRESAVPVPVLKSPSGLPSTSRGPSLKTRRLLGSTSPCATTDTAGTPPGSPSSWVMVTRTGTSRWGLEITTANCWAAALLLAPRAALSRSAAQYSQPTLLRDLGLLAEAGCIDLQRQATPWARSQASLDVVASTAPRRRPRWSGRSGSSSRSVRTGGKPRASRRTQSP